MENHTPKSTLVIGGTRSGKSGHALALAQKCSLNRKVFIATATPDDEEMQQRIQQHQSERGKDWVTIEAPIELPKAIAQQGASDAVLVIDCITLWISNLLIRSTTFDSTEISRELRRLIQTLRGTTARVYIVSNEVGSGVVPENRMARQFRDLAGMANQKLAAWADQVIWMVAGIPVTIKSWEGTAQ